MAAPQQPKFVPFVTDLGLKSDLNMHRAYSGSFRVRIEARHRVVAAIDFFERLIFEWSNDQNGLRRKEFKPPSPFPQKGQAGAGMVPPCERRFRIPISAVRRTFEK